MLDTVRYWGGAPIRLRMRRQVASFVKATQNSRGAQNAVLKRLIALNADSDFGREHGFSEIRNVADFRARLPISDYEYFRPYIERLKNGESSALLGPQNRLLMFALTSGTTSGAKYIPITSQFMDDYRLGWRIWGVCAYDDHRALYKRRIVQLSSDYDQFRTPGGTPCGNISGLACEMLNPLIQTMYTVPKPVMKIKDPRSKYYAMLRAAITDSKVGIVTTANPSTLLHLAKLADECREDLIRDIADGTLSTKVTVDDEIRRGLQRKTRANPQRARELEAIVNRTGHLYPKDFWPDLELLSVWTGGSMGPYLAGLPQFYGQNNIRDHGLSASEGRMTIPLSSNTSSGVLDATSHFFEFIPEEEMGSADPTVLAAHELIEDRNYFILLTTASGLYRYDIHDVVRCTGFLGTTPTLEFLNKGAHISSITGEKISESQIVAAVRESVDPLGLELGHFTVVPSWGEPPQYRFLVEETNLPSADVGAKIVASTDQYLKTLNPEYDEKRNTGRLGPMTMQLLPKGTWEKFCLKRQSRLGGSLEQYKHPCLVPQLEFYQEFMAEFVNGCRTETDGIPRPYSSAANRVDAK
ncbi:GH3 auxin-responsive promoter [Symmachiella macrocystis]|uniref:GH3 auxin-responsive promoter n=1 Tax=Symmachiella macrocystis TaxID=2527985 RepID=A0A5C6BSG5_9PLAN|nr:GH3 auxin-responsive promoter family protein [Symmachiella macrocystis]TWU13644.1 GH3 auxin-responsive promoter [Symmachiella macrocystis]